MDEESIFLRALEIAGAAERAAYLAGACGNDQPLRARVDSLLKHDAAAGRFLEVPPAALQQTFSTSAGDTVESEMRADWRGWLMPCEKPGCLGLLGAYEILDVLGQGGMGVVLRAQDPKLRRQVAIKVMAGTLRDAAVGRFLREAQAAAAVSHEHVVSIHAVHDDHARPHLVLELVEGISLQQKIEREGPLAAAEVRRIGTQIAAGLEAAHRRGVIHRDIKPANILLESGTGRVKITDFGLARAIDDAKLTREGQIAGTPQFMSPEQALGRPADERGDLFSLGSVLYAMCTGRPPFSSSSAVAAMRAICDDEPTPIRDLNEDIPPWLETVIGRLLEKDPNRRIQTAAEVVDLLRQPATPASSAASPVAISEHKGASAARGRGGPLAILAGAALLLCAGVIVVVVNRDGLKTRVKVPAGANVVVGPDGDVQVDLGGATRNARQRPPEAVREHDEWVKSVARLESRALVLAVSEKLKQLNQGFDGRLVPTLEGEQVVGVELVADNVSNLAPMRAFASLRTLVCRGSDVETPAQLADLSPLRGLPLTNLSCGRTRVSDLAPLEDMALEILDCSDTPVSSLLPLADMPLRHLSVQNTQIDSLRPLEGRPLRTLNCSHTPVTDFSPLKGLKLEAIYFDGTRVADLSPLREMPLRALNWRGYDFQAESLRQVVKSIATLEEINSLPASEFWQGPGAPRD